MVPFKARIDAEASLQIKKGKQYFGAGFPPTSFQLSEKKGQSLTNDC
jgi:hypothetical protein